MAPGISKPLIYNYVGSKEGLFERCLREASGLLIGDLDAMTVVWSSVFGSLVTWWCDHPGMAPEEMGARCDRLFAAVFGSAPDA